VTIQVISDRDRSHKILGYMIYVLYYKVSRKHSQYNADLYENLAGCISDLQMVVRNWQTHHSLFLHDQVWGFLW